MNALTSAEMNSNVNVSKPAKHNRLLVTYRRVICKRPDGSYPDGTVPHVDRECSVAESLNLVHPDDAREHDSRNRWNAFRDLGDMFRGNPAYFDVNYTKYPAAA